LDKTLFPQQLWQVDVVSPVVAKLSQALQEMSQKPGGHRWRNCPSECPDRPFRQNSAWERVAFTGGGGAAG
jgi:hypothetical protein